MPMARARSAQRRRLAMLSVLDRHLKLWHVVLANVLALGLVCRHADRHPGGLPGVKLFRCPIGMCLGYYSPNELNATLARIGRNGRQFLAETLLPLDMVLPALLLVAFDRHVRLVQPAGPGRCGAAERWRPLCVPRACRCSIASPTMPRTGRWWSPCRPIPTSPTASRAGRASSPPPSRSWSWRRSASPSRSSSPPGARRTAPASDAHHRLGENGRPPRR